MFGDGITALVDRAAAAAGRAVGFRRRLSSGGSSSSDSGGFSGGGGSFGGGGASEAGRLELVAMGIRRIGKHLLEHRWRARRIFTPGYWLRSSRRSRRARPRIPARSAFVVEGALDGAPLFRDQSARRARAGYLFATADLGHRPQQRRADLSAARRPPCRDRRRSRHRRQSRRRRLGENLRGHGNRFQGGKFRERRIKGIAAVSRQLARYFPAQGAGPNELPDAPVVM